MIKIEEDKYVLSIEEIEGLINKCIEAIEQNKTEQYKELSEKIDEALVVVKAWRKRNDAKTIDESIDTILNRFDQLLPTDYSLGKYEVPLKVIIREEFQKLTGKIRTREW